MKVICDQMLGSLAKWLRILGIDTFYASSQITDDELLTIAQHEGRILLTRDKELLIRCQKEKLQSIKIENTDLDEQLKELMNKIEFNKKLILSRCTRCNELLASIHQNDVRGKVPKKVFERNNKFWYCSKCQKYYWKGSHYDSMIEKINTMKKSKLTTF